MEAPLASALLVMKSAKTGRCRPTAAGSPGTDGGSGLVACNLPSPSLTRKKSKPKPRSAQPAARPTRSSARKVLPVSVMPTPTTLASISTTSAAIPRCRSAIAKVSPPIPAPTIKTRCTAAIAPPPLNTPLFVSCCISGACAGGNYRGWRDYRSAVDGL
jgi:hypothetical protein